MRLSMMSHQTNMTEDAVRKIIQDELKELLKIDRFVFNKHLQILDARNIQLGRTNGTQIGTATDQLLSFYGVAPVNQPDTVSDPSGAGSAGVDQPARDGVIALIDRLQELGLIA